MTPQTDHSRGYHDARAALSSHPDLYRMAEHYRHEGRTLRRAGRAADAEAAFSIGRIYEREMRLRVKMFPLNTEGGE